MLLSLSLDTTTKSSGSDGISAIMLKETAISTAPGIPIQTGIIIVSFLMPGSQRIETQQCLKL